MNTTRTTWGRVRFGNGRISALAVAAVAGAPLALGVALAAWALGTIDHPAIGIPVFAFMTYFPIVGLVFAFVIDRNTLSGAPKNPDESIESRWYDLAAQRAFLDVILITGVALFIMSIADLEFDASWALIGVLTLAACSFGIRYAIIMRREA